MTLEFKETEIDVQGQSVNCRNEYNYSEYTVESADLPVITIADCVRALRRVTRRRTGKQRPNISIELDLSESEKAMWDYNVLGIWMECKRSYIDLQFSANSSI